MPITSTCIPRLNSRTAQATGSTFAIACAPLYRARVTKNCLPAWPSDPALFLDVDGTLLEFADAPHDVEPTHRFKALLARLAVHDDGAVAFVSGRTIGELDRLLAPHRFALAAVHGSERRAVDGHLMPSAIDPTGLDPARAELRALEAEHDGLLLEDKAISLALHYRRRPELEAAILAHAGAIADLLPPEFVLLPGKMVLEIKPADVNKGSAIRAFMSEAPFAGRTPVFIGDDVTDEAGFGVVNELGGVSIKVSNGETIAKWYLRDVNATLAWLEEVLAE